MRVAWVNTWLEMVLPELPHTMSLSFLPIAVLKLSSSSGCPSSHFL